MHDFKDINYLKYGTPKQLRAFEAITNLDILSRLSKFSPIVTSTICTDTDIDSSDLDIICCFKDKGRFAQIVQNEFSHLPLFKIINSISAPEAWIAEFQFEGFIFEVFGDQTPSEQQNAYRHMLIASRLLEFGGDELKRRVRELKNEGFKTEPAFASCLKLQGDPYKSLLNLEKINDEDLSVICRNSYPFT